MSAIRRGRFLPLRRVLSIISDMLFLGYDFLNEALLEEALTTPSYRMDFPSARDNQRLEFLGDAVLGQLAAESLFTAFPDEAEGTLTIRRTHMVSSAALCAAAVKLDLAKSLKRNHAAAPLQNNAKTLADAVEAIIGAAYLDGGYEAAAAVFRTLGLSMDFEAAKWGGNPKGALQVRAQAMKPPRYPVYTLVSTAGKAHEPVFTVSVAVEGLGEASASARSHKEAEARAAANLLETI